MDTMGPFIVGGFAVGMVCVIYWIATHNRLVRLQMMIQESWANVDVALKRRHDLIPNLVATVKAYANHEQEVFQRLAEARERATRLLPEIAARRADEEALVLATNQLLARAEAYPELKASSHFLELQQELINSEDRIAAARRFYNGNVREWNATIGSFPTSIIANSQQAAPQEYFEIDVLEVQAVPQIGLSRS